MNVLGLDLSINGTGICAENTAGETLVGKPTMGDQRLWRVFAAVDYYVSGAVGSPGPAPARAPTPVRARVGLAVIEHNLPHGHSGQVLDYVHGAARTALAKNNVPFAYVYPTTLKLFATGESDASKAAMVAAVTAASGGWVPASDDVADAWWLRMMGLVALDGSRIEDARDRLGPDRLRALSAVDWPEPVMPYGVVSTRTQVRKKCRHGAISLRNGDTWLHPFSGGVCVKPPKTTSIR